MPDRITYVINHYPKLSHTFIRREILALEQSGFAVQRIAMRGWEGELPDPEDIRERSRTRYVLGEGLHPLVLEVIRTLFLMPRGFFRALLLASE